jgi:hypothetical protein
MRYENKLTYPSPHLHLAAKGVMRSYMNGGHQDMDIMRKSQRDTSGKFAHD